MYSAVPSVKVTRAVAGVMLTVWVLFCAPTAHPLGAVSPSMTVVPEGMLATLEGMLRVKLPVVPPVIVMVAAASSTYCEPELMVAVTARLPLGASLRVMPTSAVPSASSIVLLGSVNMTVGVTTAFSSVMVTVRVAVATPASDSNSHPCGRLGAANSSSISSSDAISVRAVTVSSGADVPVGSVHAVPLRLPPAETASR